MTEPRQNLLRCMRLQPVGQNGPVDHDHRQPQTARRRDLGRRTGTARVLRDHKINLVVLHQRKVVRHGEGATRLHDGMVGKGQHAVGRIHQPKQIEMLRMGGKVVQMHTPNRQHDPRCGTLQRRHGTRDVRDMGPAVTALRLPRCPRQRDQRHAGLGTGQDGIAAHLCGERMGGVDDVRDPMRTQIADQPCNTAKAPDALGQRLLHRLFNAARIGHHTGNRVVTQCPAQRSRFGCAAKNKKVGDHV